MFVSTCHFARGGNFSSLAFGYTFGLHSYTYVTREYRVVHLVAKYSLMTSNYKSRNNMNFLHFSTILISMSTKGCSRPDRSSCKERVSGRPVVREKVHGVLCIHHSVVFVAIQHMWIRPLMLVVSRVQLQSLRRAPLRKGGGDLLDGVKHLSGAERGGLSLHIEELCKNTPAKFRKSLSTCSAASPKIALWRNISTRHSPNLAGMFLHNSVQGVSD